MTDQVQAPEATTEYTWRPATHDDLPAIHGLRHAIAAAENDTHAPNLDELAREMDDPWSAAETESRVVFAADGTLAAYARVFANPNPQDEEARAYLDDNVHPDHAAALHEPVMAWLMARGRERLGEIVAATGYTGPRVMRVGTVDFMTGRIALYERLGFEPIRYFYRMQRDLHQPIPDRPVPDGLRLIPFQPEHSEPARQALDEAFRDHWGNEPISAEDWELFFVGSSNFRPDLTPVALDGDEVAAVSFNTVDPEENARQAQSTGWIRTLGTRRPWRKRGLASALLVWSMRAFREAGLDTATLGVDAENPTGALGLYEGLGFVTQRRFIAFRYVLPND